FDLLHMGHIYYLKEAKKLGDTLAVVVATDTTVRKLKHDPITPQEIRVNLIKELKMVDEAYLGYEKDMYRIVEEIKPDIIALGFDQIHDDIAIQKELKKRKLNVQVVRLPKYQGESDLEGTRRIIQKVIAAHEFQKKMQRIEGEP
ncbi:MAG TPA: adenylyltransferase/cytidyltransferase family protein, partial [Candidatus Thermoplasmatota archaeon]|nr:adenylyltransferase/cytidyltransferase family protein [Candidatus Thermoplasmatota archaeon]